mmetsp:Transcript_33385/g.42648  ORF Transcript_33385/g.42648 Transcript_33385/m.42648 type:complete len:349 (-) Transcript_33385:526-1572(-)
MGTCASKKADASHCTVLHESSPKIKALSRQRSLVLELEEEELNKWKSIHQQGHIPCERSGHATVIVGSTVFIFGGYGGSDPVHLSDLHMFDLENRQWNKIRDKGDIPCPRTAFAMCYNDKNSIFLWGGTDHDLQGLADQDIYEFQIHYRKWNRVTTYNRGILDLRYFGRSATAYSDGILFFGGGVKGGRFTNELLRLDQISYRWERMKTTGQMPSARYKHQAVLVDDKLYIVGGGCYLPPQDLIDVYVLCLKTWHWSVVQTVGDVPEGRAAHTCEYDSVDQCIYMWGGFNKSLVPLQDLHKLCLKTLTWTPICDAKDNHNVPPCRSFHSSCFYNGALYSFNGSDGEKR